MAEIARAAVLGATGATGRVLARELLDRGGDVRVVSRSASNLARDFGRCDAEQVVADALTAEGCRRAVEGCDVVFDCVGAPLGKFENHLIVTRAALAAAGAVGARMVLITGYWSNAPSKRPISAASPARPTNRYSRIRIEQERLVREAGGCAVVLPDFFGPGAGVSVLNDAIKSVLDGRAALWPGAPTALRDFVYAPDLGRPIVDLASRDEAFGARWVLAGSGAEKPAALIAQAATGAGVRARVKRVTPMVIRLASLARRDIREFKPVYPIYNAPATFDDAATRALIGDWPVTGYTEALPATVAWIRGAR